MQDVKKKEIINLNIKKSSSSKKMEKCMRKNLSVLYLWSSQKLLISKIKQKVVVNNSGSTTQTIFAGFPHGSIDTNRPHECKSIEALEFL